MKFGYIAERLFQIVQLIRGRRLSTARFLERLEVSERTVCRDVADLMVQGVPIEGEAGAGYHMSAHFDLPPLERAAAESLAVHAPAVGPDEATRVRLQTLRTAAETRRKVRIAYLDLEDKRSERDLRPLGCFCWSEVWTLAAWCEAREDFRNFRVDRIERLDLLDECFRDEAGKTLADLFRATEQEMSERDASTDA